ncbi:MAG TPA: hypothetical protein VFJ43_09020, partial [Bacteroidia bacterium]|nr:hypothetical protein [Bacteroidia bacterium]
MDNDRKFMSSKPEPLKNILNSEFICLLAKAFKKADPEFDENRFEKFILGGSWNQKELKQRIRHISSAINEFLPYP